MQTKDLLKKVRKIEIKSKGLSSQIFSGEYHSAFKGRGMTFSEVREYSPGDEIRTIDWNVTARMRTPYVKVFEEEREMTVMLLIDISASENFGTGEQLKKERLAEIAAVLAYSAIQNNDKAGAILFTDKVEKFIPPKKGKHHILRIIRELIEFTPSSRGTDIGAALDYLNRSIKKKSIAFLLSDFLDQNFERSIRIANRKHDLIALRVYDSKENELPDLGLVPFKDPETNQVVWINTGNKKVRIKIAAEARKREITLRDSFRKSGVDYVSVSTGESYVKPLINLFKSR